MLLKSLQARPTLCDPMDSSPQGSSVLGILQERILEWFAISYYIKLKGFCTVKETIDKRKKKRKGSLQNGRGYLQTKETIRV